MNEENGKEYGKEYGAKKRLGEILSVFTRYELVKGVSPEKLRLIVEDLGPTFVKLGQIMSMRQDILPAAYCKELGKLRSEVSPIGIEEVRAVIRQEYGVSFSEVFSSFDPVPIGSASIAQVHAAVLKDGRRVVVKVQRPGIYKRMAQDITLLRKAAGILKIAHITGGALDFPVILDEMWDAARQEMDFLIEARHIEQFTENNRDVVYVTCPWIEHSLTTSKVLVMEYIEGVPIDDIKTLNEMGYDIDEIGAKFAENYVKQITDDGFFHADPHPGNIRIRDGKIVWLDLGMIGTISKRDKLLLRGSVSSIVKHDVSELKNTLLMMGVYKVQINHIKLYADLDDLLTKYGTLDIGSMDLGGAIEDILEVANSHHIRMPGGVSMLGRGLITIEGVLSAVCPDISLIEIMANHMRSEFLRNLDINKELRESGRAIIDSGRKALDIPGQIFDILKMTIRGQTKLNLDLTAQQPISAMDRMVNKIVVCIMSASLLVGSSLICTTDMTPKILGIPAIGFLGYFAAIVLGGWLVWSILKKN